MKDTLLDNLHMADINPRICGVEACAPGHSFGPAVREYFLLHYVVRGKGIFRRGKREYTLQAGEIFVIRPGEVTYYEADMRDPWEYMWAGFDCAPPFAALLEQDVLRLPGALQNFFAHCRLRRYACKGVAHLARSSMSCLRSWTRPAARRRGTAATMWDRL